MEAQRRHRPLCGIIYHINCLNFIAVKVKIFTAQGVKHLDRNVVKMQGLRQILYINSYIIMFSHVFALLSFSIIIIAQISKKSSVSFLTIARATSSLSRDEVVNSDCCTENDGQRPNLRKRGADIDGAPEYLADDFTITLC
jgi:hypothetical protein